MEIKITKKLLKDYSRYKREISLVELELSEMLTSESGLGSSTINDYTKGYPIPQAVVGFDYELYERRKTILINKKAKVTAVEDWIENIEDAQTRAVFRMRYIHNMTWTKIANKLGYGGNTDYPRLYIRDRYLKDNNIF